MANITEFMTPAPWTIGNDQPLSRAHAMMRQHGIRHLPVLHGGKLVGVVSLGDLHLLEALGKIDLQHVTVEEAMTPEPYVVTEETPMREVAAQMAEHKYGTAIVARESRVIGIFTTVDALRALVLAGES
ncbi:MAG: CBS domain-containing protein [Polyangiales bacterium]